MGNEVAALATGRNDVGGGDRVPDAFHRARAWTGNHPARALRFELTAGRSASDRQQRPLRSCDYVVGNWCGRSRTPDPSLVVPSARPIAPGEIPPGTLGRSPEPG